MGWSVGIAGAGAAAVLAMIAARRAGPPPEAKTTETPAALVATAPRSGWEAPAKTAESELVRSDAFDSDVAAPSVFAAQRALGDQRALAVLDAAIENATRDQNADRAYVARLNDLRSKAQARWEQYRREMALSGVRAMTE